MPRPKPQIGPGKWIDTRRPDQNSATKPPPQRPLISLSSHGLPTPPTTALRKRGEPSTPSIGGFGKEKRTPMSHKQSSLNRFVKGKNRAEELRTNEDQSPLPLGGNRTVLGRKSKLEIFDDNYRVDDTWSNDTPQSREPPSTRRTVEERDENLLTSRIGRFSSKVIAQSRSDGRTRSISRSPMKPPRQALCSPSRKRTQSPSNSSSLFPPHTPVALVSQDGFPQSGSMYPPTPVPEIDMERHRRLAGQDESSKRKVESPWKYDFPDQYSDDNKRKRDDSPSESEKILRSAQEVFKEYKRDKDRSRGTSSDENALPKPPPKRQKIHSTPSVQEKVFRRDPVGKAGPPIPTARLHNALRSYSPLPRTSVLKSSSPDMTPETVSRRTSPGSSPNQRPKNNSSQLIPPSSPVAAMVPSSPSQQGMGQPQVTMTVNNQSSSHPPLSRHSDPWTSHEETLLIVPTKAKVPDQFISSPLNESQGWFNPVVDEPRPMSNANEVERGEVVHNGENPRYVGHVGAENEVDAEASVTFLVCIKLLIKHLQLENTQGFTFRIASPSKTVTMSPGSTPVRRSQRIASQCTASPSPRISSGASATPIKSPKHSSEMKTPSNRGLSQKTIGRSGKRSPGLSFRSQYEADDDISSSHPELADTLLPGMFSAGPDQTIPDSQSSPSHPLLHSQTSAKNMSQLRSQKLFTSPQISSSRSQKHFSSTQMSPSRSRNHPTPSPIFDETGCSGLEETVYFRAFNIPSPPPHRLTDMPPPSPSFRRRSSQHHGSQRTSSQVSAVVPNQPSVEEVTRPGPSPIQKLSSTVPTGQGKRKLRGDIPSNKSGEVFVSGSDSFRASQLKFSRSEEEKNVKEGMGDEEGDKKRMRVQDSEGWDETDKEDEENEDEPVKVAPWTRAAISSTPNTSTSTARKGKGKTTAKKTKTSGKKTPTQAQEKAASLEAFGFFRKRKQKEKRFEFGISFDDELDVESDQSDEEVRESLATTAAKSVTNPHKTLAKVPSPPPHPSLRPAGVRELRRRKAEEASQAVESTQWPPADTQSSSQTTATLPLSLPPSSFPDIQDRAAADEEIEGEELPLFEEYIRLQERPLSSQIMASERTGEGFSSQSTSMSLRTPASTRAYMRELREGRAGLPMSDKE
ncbi:hypothetical protein I306_01965 [Cryptococcus gattii EJB2]|uniref:Uncharacterized protein n=1 Tax=Cryptococcus gattii EJB2 TaxID=1296103 RepID=A0ABR5BZ56_9TREE|nr:hypothetical protein I306_01965 [Cryptococcus gattii EJB2]